MAYVFLHLLPELASGGSELSEAPGLMDYVPTPLAEALLELPPPAPPPPPVAPLDKVPPPLDILVPLRSEPRSLRPSGFGYRTQRTVLSTALARPV